jgi:hypothetical protein
MAGSKSGRDDKENLTSAGCVLTTLSFAVMMGVAVQMVMWRDSAGRPLPRLVAIMSPLLIGALFHGIGSGMLWLAGLPVLSRPKKDDLDWPDV